jgi:hypothetical protein
MACLDTELCQKIDDLTSKVAQIQTDNIATQNLILSIKQDVPLIVPQIEVLQSGISLVLGFLSFFLFFFIIKFLYNFFKSIL